MSIEAVREYIALMWLKYQSLKRRKARSEIVDHLVLTLDIHRKSAIRLLKKCDMPTKQRGSGKTARIFEVMFFD